MHTLNVYYALIFGKSNRHFAMGWNPRLPNRSPEPVRRALGLRSTTDPLFQVDKIFSRVKYMDLDPDKLDAFFEASEDWNSAMNMSNSMAFISQFGVRRFEPKVSCKLFLFFDNS